MKLHAWIAAGALATTSALASAPASAASLGVAELLSTFNVVTEGNLQVQSQEIEGRAYVGGNLTGGTVQFGIRNVPGGADDVVIVRGNLAVATINMQNGGNLRVAGAGTGTVELNAGDPALGTRTARFGGAFDGLANQGTVQSNLGSDDAFQAGFPVVDFDYLRNESLRLSRLPGTAVDTSNPNTLQFFGGTTPTDLTVLTVDIASLMSGSFFVDNQAAGTLLINVSGEVGTFGMNPAGDNALAAAENVLWNFFEATEIAVNTVIVGSVLAPNARMTGFGGSSESSIIAQSLLLDSGELHSRPFAGELPRDETPDPLSVIPLPATGWLLLGGLGALGLAHRRRRRA
ncbi:MAG: choice-of-anchor A family protein [Alkalilacustris sp.]